MTCVQGIVIGNYALQSLRSICDLQIKAYVDWDIAVKARPTGMHDKGGGAGGGTGRRVGGLSHDPLLKNVVAGPSERSETHAGRQRFTYM